MLRDAWGLTGRYLPPTHFPTHKHPCKVLQGRARSTHLKLQQRPQYLVDGVQVSDMSTEMIQFLSLHFWHRSVSTKLWHVGTVWVHTQYNFNLSSSNSCYHKFVTPLGQGPCLLPPPLLTISGCTFMILWVTGDKPGVPVCGSTEEPGDAPGSEQLKRARRTAEISSHTRSWRAERWHILPRVTERAVSQSKPRPS